MAVAYEEGIKLVELVPKRPDISDDLFHYHWYAIHGPFVRGIEGVRRYIQHHRIYDAVPGLPPLRYEGLVEAWFDSAEAMAGLAADPQYADHVAPHEPIQVDLHHMRNLVTRSRVYLQEDDLGPAAASVVLCVARRPDLTPAAFQERWKAHSATALRLPGLQRYVQQDVVEGGDPDRSGFAAVSFATFRDVFALEEAWASPEGGAAVIADLARFALPSACAALVSHERPVIWP